MTTKSLLCLALLTGAATAPRAGAYYTGNDVWIATGDGTYDATAAGTVYDTRHSADSVQYIGCSLGAGRAGSYMYCFARSSSGQTVSCYTSTPTSQMATAIAAIDAFASVQFYWTLATGECKSLYINKTSQHLPVPGIVL